MSVLKAFAQHLFGIFITLGGFGLLILGILDSSFLFMPLGNDLLMIAMTARKSERMLFYAVMASAGSVLGTLLVDIVFRRGGEQALEKHLPPKRLEYVKRKVTKRAGWAVALACVMPPPFPFTPFVMAAAALQYPRGRLLVIVGALRMLRFTTEGLLAMYYGPRILKLAERPEVRIAVIAFAFLCIVGSVLSVMRWLKRSHRAPANRPPDGKFGIERA